MWTTYWTSINGPMELAALLPYYYNHYLYYHLTCITSHYYPTDFSTLDISHSLFSSILTIDTPPVWMCHGASMQVKCLPNTQFYSRKYVQRCHLQIYVILLTALCNNSPRLGDAYKHSVNYPIIGSNNGLLPVRHLAIIWNNDGLLSIRSLETNFS